MAFLAVARGLKPDEKHLVSLTYGLIIGSACLSLFVCGLRLYSRLFILKKFGWDDGAVIVALICTQIFNGLGIGVVYWGSGRHQTDLSESQIAMWLKLYYVATCYYLYVSLSVKISLLVFLRRVFPLVWIQRLTLGMMIFQVLFTVSGSLVMALRCTPARAAFDLTITNSKCLSEFQLYQVTLYQAVLIFTTDVIILLTPMPILCRLHMPARKIAVLMMVFSTGIIACISPLVRFSTLGYLRNGATDLTYDSTSSLYWMAIEFNLGLVAGSLSSLRVLPCFRQFGSSASRGYNSSGAQPQGFLPMDNLPKQRSSRKKGSHSMGTTILQDTQNESQERIINQNQNQHQNLRKGDAFVQTQISETTL
ncbi:hypothetical protein BO70DRAFT_357418 [Aspergillus heteromorphus CBS 117.55]|uniref:Rhodopsin domain-containing protein n=1 Tax=Aspergillus heteromorphus CBS 117.55 TaxID=1448321 RepID=A0A317X6U1_9EURO|nr:uncharacterized protein BO70DRAFT_357418 [Aspergillus heteromorphus CBS 117.55]PWY92290.1 hypothetical protein BO70DRAFT_357418 [Aspergillus heteromorphus CBS 117.55]